MLNSLDPDEARQNVGPHLGPNCLQSNQQKTLGVRVNIKAVLMLYGLKTENTLTNL